MTVSVLESEPAVASQLFGASIEQARKFAGDLGGRGEALGLIGPLERERLWSRHILNSVLVAPLLRAGSRVGDVGSGAGLPGLVLAIARPDVRVVLIEPMERRVEWLRSEAAALELVNVEVIRARAEDVDTGGLLDQVTARAVSSLTKLLPLVTPLVGPAGELLLMKGASVDAEVHAARTTIKRLGLIDGEVVVLGTGLVPDITRVFRATVGSNGGRLKTGVVTGA